MPCRPTGYRSFPRLKVHLDGVLSIVMALVVVVQLLLHSSVDQQTRSADANAGFRDDRIEVVSNWIHSSK